MSSRSAATERSEARPASSTESPPERVDCVFAILQNRRRRLVLEYLRTHESTTQSDLARHVAAVENGTDEAAVTSTQRKRVYVSLYQAHLPKLDDFGAVSFDRNRGTVERTPRAEELLRYLDRFDDRPPASRSGDAYYLGVVALLAGALLVVFAGEFGALAADLSLGLAVLLSLGGVAVVLYGIRR